MYGTDKPYYVQTHQLFFWKRDPLMPSYMFLCSSNNREVIRFNIANPPLQVNIPSEGNNLALKFFWFGSPSFNVEVTSDRDIDNFSQLADILSHTLAGLYDSIGLAQGTPLSIRIEGFSVVGSRTFAQISDGLPSFGEAITAAGLELNDWISLCIGSPQIRACLRDIRLGMQTPGEAAVHCFRAIERVRQTFSTQTGDRKKTWELLGEALNLQRSWLDTYTTHAIAVRHGEILELDLIERNKCFSQAATVVIRYAAFLKGNKTKLSTATFELLV
jgi:hypothetical protein